MQKAVIWFAWWLVITAIYSAKNDTNLQQFFTRILFTGGIMILAYILTEMVGL